MKKENKKKAEQLIKRFDTLMESETRDIVWTGLGSKLKFKTEVLPDLSSCYWVAYIGKNLPKQLGKKGDYLFYFEIDRDPITHKCKAWLHLGDDIKISNDYSKKTRKDGKIKEDEFLCIKDAVKACNEKWSLLLASLLS